jgi:hypothetical protein
MPLGAGRFGLLGGAEVDLGKLELIETQTISSSFADFESLGSYNVHLFTFNNLVPNEQTNLGFQFSNDGGTSYISSGYQYAFQIGYPDYFTELKSTSVNRILIGGTVGVATEDSMNGYMYCYNLGNSKYSFITLHTVYTLLSSSIYSYSWFGSGVLPTAEIHNGVRFGSGNFNVLGSGTISLYGIAES